MNISVKLTLIPLQDTFEEHIISFIKKLRASGLTVLENPLSTKVYGEYDVGRFQSLGFGIRLLEFGILKKFSF